MKFRRKRGGARRKVRYVAVIPSLITLGNGVCGLLAIQHLLKPEPATLVAAWLILLGILLDGLDGLVAKATRSRSSFGAQLDSLCDVVTFGVVPAVLMLTLAGANEEVPSLVSRSLVAISVIYASCVLIRLARFNVEAARDSSHKSFAGLPSPGAAGFLAATVITYHLCLESQSATWSAVGAAIVQYAVPPVTLILALLMVTRVPYPHFMTRMLRGYRPFMRLVELVLAIVLVVVLHQVAILVAFAIYVASGPAVVAKGLIFPRSRERGATDVEKHESLH